MSLLGCLVTNLTCDRWGAELPSFYLRLTRLTALNLPTSPTCSLQPGPAMIIFPLEGTAASTLAPVFCSCAPDKSVFHPEAPVIIFIM